MITAERPGLGIAGGDTERFSGGLDYYKPTMSQLAYDQEPDAEVSFTFHNRGAQRLLDYVDPAVLARRFEALQRRGWSRGELDFLSSIKSSDGEHVFAPRYLDYLRTNPLPPVRVGYDTASGDIALDTKGPWALATFWETIVLSETNEAYFEGYLQAHNINPGDVYDEGDRRLSEKIEVLRANPDVKFADFGTRRHFSLRWQRHVLERLVDECPDNFIGTSNVGLAQSCELRPIGTFAHEMPMTYAGLADARGEDIRASHGRFLSDWHERYGTDLSIALTDTFGTDFFFADFSQQQASDWKGVRQDSGDPYEFGERLIRFYESSGVDSRSKTVVFSDGLDIGQIVKLSGHFDHRLNVLFGWGTTLTNDLGIKSLNIVMKATHVELPALGIGADTVKLSDDAGKHTGSAGQVARYQQIFDPSGASLYK